MWLCSRSNCRSEKSKTQHDIFMVWHLSELIQVPSHARSFVFRPSATKSGRPYGVTSASSSLSCRTPDPWLIPGGSAQRGGGQLCVGGPALHCHVTVSCDMTVGGARPLCWVNVYLFYEFIVCVFRLIPCYKKAMISGQLVDWHSIVLQGKKTSTKKHGQFDWFSCSSGAPGCWRAVLNFWLGETNHSTTQVCKLHFFASQLPFVLFLCLVLQKLLSLASRLNELAITMGVFSSHWCQSKICGKNTQVLSLSRQLPHF